MNENSGLSEREIEILKLVATGVSNKEIARELFISPNTVKVHLKNIFSKIGVISRTEAAMYAVQRGWVTATNVESLTISEGEENQSIGNGVERFFTQRWRGIPYWEIGSILLFVFLFIAVIMGVILQYRIKTVRQISPNSTLISGWQSRAEMPTSRYGLAGAVFDNQIYTIGGESNDGVTGIIERYDPTTDTWQGLTPKPLAVADICAGVIGGKIYVPGGRLKDGSTTDLIEIYDPRKDIWEKGGRLSYPLSAYACVVFEGKLLIFGGWNGKDYTDQVLEYNPNQDMWKILPSLPSKRGYTGAAILGGKIYLIGGYDGKESINQIEIYAPDIENSAESVWESGPNIPVGIYAMGTTALAEKLYIVGGIKNGSSGSDYSYEYNPIEQNYRLLQNPISQLWSSLVLIPQGSFIYAFGGKVNDKPVGNNLRFQVIYTVALPVIR